MYHPVSLHVVRGAAEYCGFKFGRLKQLRNNPTGLYAIYHAQVTVLPKHCQGKSLEYIHFALSECFNADIKVETVKQSTKSGITAIIRTSILQDPEPFPLPEPHLEPLHSEPGGGGGWTDGYERNLKGTIDQVALRINHNEEMLGRWQAQFDKMATPHPFTANEAEQIRKMGMAIQALQDEIATDKATYQALVNEATSL